MKKRPRLEYWNQRVRDESGAAGTLTNQRGLKGCKLGPASDGRTLSAEEREKIEAQMRRDGKL